MNLKPVTIIHTTYPRYSQNTTQQIMLLKALRITNDPKKLRDMIGVKKVADVFRTLDKMALRKEFHTALARSGIDFEFIVSGLKNEALTAGKAGDRIKVYQTLLRSLGLDKYEEPGEGGAKWEDEVMKGIAVKEETKELPATTLEEYPVQEPIIPESVKKIRKAEQEIGKSLYE